MFRHIVLVRWKPEATDIERQAMREAIEHLPSQVPEIIDARIDLNIGRTVPLRHGHGIRLRGPGRIQTLHRQRSTPNLCARAGQSRGAVGRGATCLVNTNKSPMGFAPSSSAFPN